MNLKYKLLIPGAETTYFHNGEHPYKGIILNQLNYVQVLI